MIVGLDLDNVLLNFNDALHAYHNDRYGTKYEREQFRYDLTEMWGCSEEEVIKRVFDFYQSPKHWDTLPVSGAVDGVKSLKERHNLFVVTAKSEALKDKTLEWIDKHFAQMFDGVYFTNQYHGGGLKRTKGEVCKELGIEVFVDDFLENAHDVAGSAIPVLLFDTPWNQGEVKSPITRVYSWDEIVETLSKRS